MSKTGDPQVRGSGDFLEYASGTDATTWATNPADWVQVIGAGSVVVTTEAGNNRTITTDSTEPVLVMHGPFSALVSMSAPRVRMGYGAVPAAIPAPGNTNINGATVPAGGALTTGNVLQVSGAGALSYGAVNLAGGTNYVTGVLPATNVQRYATAATQTASWTVAVDTLYILNTTNTAATATLPALAVGNDGHAVAMFNAGTTAGVWTPASGDTVGGTASSNATLAGPATGVMRTLVANLATRRWIPLA